MRPGPRCGVTLGCLLLCALAIPAQELPAPEREVFQQDVQWSPDGEWVAFSEFEGGKYSREKWAAYVARSDGSDRRLVAKNALFVSWSADGERLAFSSNRDGNNEIYTVAIDGSDLLRLTDNEAADSAPAWSPDGLSIAFTSDREGTSEIWVMAADGSNPRRVTETDTGDYGPAWSPDGAWIAFYRTIDEEVDRVFLVSADGSGERVVTPDANRSTFPGFLPDGRIGFSCDDRSTGWSGVVHVAADGTDRRQAGPPGAFWGRWSPDGSTLAFIHGRWPKSAIYTRSGDGSGVRKIVN